MTLAIDATFHEANGTVELTIDGATADAGDWTLIRTDVNGTVSVRVYADLDLTDPLTVTDHECALAGPITYTVTADAETATASVTPVTTRTWLSFPIYPNYNIALLLGAAFEALYAPAHTVHEPLDRDDPVVVDGVFGLSAGRFEILTDTQADAAAIVAAYRRIRLAQLRVGATGQSLYHKVRGLGIVSVGRSAQRIVRGEFIEVGRPAGALVGTLGWTYGDTTALGLTYATAGEVFPTYADRTAGPA